MLNSSIHWEVGCLTDIGVNAMRVSLKTSFAAFVLSSALVGAAVPAFADSYYQGLDPNTLREPRIRYACRRRVTCLRLRSTRLQRGVSTAAV